MRSLAVLVFAVCLACLPVLPLSVAEADASDAPVPTLETAHRGDAAGSESEATHVAYESGQIYTLFGDADVITGTFEYVSYDLNVESYNYTYDESWFEGDPYTYDHELTRMSLRIAMASFGLTPDETAAGVGATTKERAARILALVGDLGFCSDLESKRLLVSYPVPEADSIGYLITSKSLDDGTLLVLVVVRGGRYLSEWGNNFEIGAGASHEGFQTAANQVQAALSGYLAVNAGELEGCKVWLCGYSRGAAVVNLVAAALDRGEVAGVSARNVYARCFECPRVTTDPAMGDAIYGNIASVVNPIDIVPRFVPSAWGYGRYGTTYVLPSVDTTVGYRELELGMRDQYSLILSSRGAPADKDADDLTVSAPGEVAILDSFVDGVATYIGSAESYSSLYQNAISKLATRQMSSGSASPASIVAELATGRAVRLVGFPITNPRTSAQAAYCFIERGAFSAHYPELCLAWADSLDTLDSSRWRTYQLVTLTEAERADVFDANGELVASVSRQTVLDNNEAPAFMAEDDSLVLVLPGDAVFDVRIEAKADAEVRVMYTLRDVALGAAVQEEQLDISADAPTDAPFGSISITYLENERSTDE